MLGFIAATARLLLDPAILGAGLLVGYLFHVEMGKLAWGLLLFVLPAVPTVWVVSHHGMLFNSTAQLIATALVAGASCWALQTMRMRPRRTAD
jgi:xanthosine utilization system XapX-like protein